MHPAVNRETARHLGERHFSIAPFLRIERKRRVFFFTLHASDLKLRANDVGRTSSRRRCRRQSVFSLGNSDMISVVVIENELCAFPMLLQ